MAKAVIKAIEFVRDLRAPMTDLQLMQKYNLSTKGLQSVFKKLVDVRAVRPDELFDRAPIPAEDTADIASIRESPRKYIEIAIPICDANHLEKLGTVRDVSGKGVGVRGVEAQKAETKILVVSAEKLFPVQPFGFRAVCRWVKRRRADGIIDSGFEITTISRKAAQEFRKIVELLSLSE